MSDSERSSTEVQLPGLDGTTEAVIRASLHRLYIGIAILAQHVEESALTSARAEVRGMCRWMGPWCTDPAGLAETDRTILEAIRDALLRLPLRIIHNQVGEPDYAPAVHQCLQIIAEHVAPTIEAIDQHLAAPAVERKEVDPRGLAR